MSQLVLTKSTIKQGVWHGVLTGPGEQAPGVVVTLLEKPVPGVTLSAGVTSGSWKLRVPIPVESISEGVQTFMIHETATGARLGSFALIAGEALGDDIRAEIDLLRAELDMLKRAFRRHCVETT